MKTLLIDGHNLLYRSFTTLPRSITNKSGEPINGVYGLIGSILRLMRELQATSVVVAFDVPEVSTFRHKLYPEYQGQRGPLGGEYAEDFVRQVSLAKKALAAMTIPTAEMAGYEADDVLATIATRLEGSGRKASIISSDRDLLQMVSPSVEVVLPANPVVVIATDEGVRERIGVTPSLIPDFKGLAGDPSDNLPGLKGIGAKTAAFLVTAYGSLEEIYERLDELKPRSRLALESQRESAFLFRQIATVVRDLPLDLRPHELPELQLPDGIRPREVLDRLNET